MALYYIALILSLKPFFWQYLFLKKKSYDTATKGTLWIWMGISPWCMSITSLEIYTPDSALTISKCFVYNNTCMKSHSQLTLTSLKGLKTPQKQWNRGSKVYKATWIENVRPELEKYQTAKKYKTDCTFNSCHIAQYSIIRLSAHSNAFKQLLLKGLLFAIAILVLIRISAAKYAQPHAIPIHQHCSGQFKHRKKVMFTMPVLVI